MDVLTVFSRPEERAWRRDLTETDAGSRGQTDELSGHDHAGEFDTPKSERSSRSVPMSMRVARELNDWQHMTRWGADGELVFAEPATGDVLRRGALLRRYRQTLKAGQLEPTQRFHDRRHTFGTAMAAAGVPMRTLQAWMGHERFSTTEIYAHYAPNPEEAAMVDRAFADPLRAGEEHPAPAESRRAG